MTAPPQSEQVHEERPAELLGAGGSCRQSHDGTSTLRAFTTACASRRRRGVSGVVVVGDLERGTVALGRPCRVRAGRGWLGDLIGHGRLRLPLMRSADQPIAQRHKQELVRGTFAEASSTTNLCNDSPCYVSSHFDDYRQSVVALWQRP